MSSADSSPLVDWLPITPEGDGWGFVPDDVPDAMMANLFGTAGNGAPLADLFDSSSDDAAMNGAAVLMNAISTGQNPANIAMILAQALGSSEKKAQVIARDQMLSAYRDAQRANFQANSDVIQGWMWSCAPDACMVCVFMDGSEHDLDEDMDSHVNCRCAMLPITRPWSDIFGQWGIDAEDIPETSIYATYEPQMNEFLMRSAQEQQQVMGKAAWLAWKQGDAPFASFVGYHADPNWGFSIYQKPLKELGLDAQDYLAQMRVPKDADLYPFRFDPESRSWVRIPEEAPPIPADADLYPYRLNPESNQWERIPEPEDESGIGRPTGTLHTEPEPAQQVQPFSGNKQCINCFRVYEGPLEGAQFEGVVDPLNDMSHGYCPECLDTGRQDFLTQAFTRANPDASEEEIARMVDAQMQKPLEENLVSEAAGEAESAAPSDLAAGEMQYSSLPGEWGAKVEETLGKDAALDWGEALGEHGNLQGPIAERAEAQAWTPMADSHDVSQALSDQLGAKVNFDNMHPAAANQFAQTLQVLQADFPEVVQGVDYIGMADDEWLAKYPQADLGPVSPRVAASNGPQIAFNQGYWSTDFADLQHTIDVLQNAADEGWYFDGAGSPASQVAHEFGHSVLRFMERSDNAEVRQLASDWVSSWNPAQITLGNYAKTSADEAFAEAFASTYFGSDVAQVDPLVEDMRDLLADMRDALDTEATGGATGATTAGDFEPGRLPQLPPGVNHAGPTRLRYEEWRMTQEAQPVYMVLSDSKQPIFADTWDGVRGTTLDASQQAALDIQRAPVKVAIWKPTGDGLTPQEVRWAIKQGANEIQVLTPNGVDILRVGMGARGDVFTSEWVTSELMPAVKDATADAYAELEQSTMDRMVTSASERTPRAVDYERINARIQAQLPQSVWTKVADQIDGITYEHLPLPVEGTDGIPPGWKPPNPLLPPAPADDLAYSSLPTETLTQESLADRNMAQLRQMARDMDVQPARTKAETIDRILAKQAEKKAPAVAEAALEGEPLPVTLRSQLDDRIVQREMLYGQQHDLIEEQANLENQIRTAASSSDRYSEVAAKQQLYRESLDKSDPEIKKFFKARDAYLKNQQVIDSSKAEFDRLEKVMDRLSVQGKQFSADYADARAQQVAVQQARQKALDAAQRLYTRYWQSLSSVYVPDFDSIAGFEMKMQQMGITFSPEDIAAKIASMTTNTADMNARIAEIKSELKAIEKPIKGINKEINKLLAQAREINADLPEALDTTRPFSDVLDLPEGHQPPNALMNKIDYRMNEPRAVTKRRIIDDIATRLKDDPAWQEYVARMDTPDNLGVYHQYVNVTADANDTKSAKLTADLIRRWGVGYRPGSPQWVAMQMAARDEFGLDAEIHAITDAQMAAGERAYAQNGDALRAFMRAMYDNTQQWFADNGISEIDVYRGFSWREGQGVPDGINWGAMQAQNTGVADIELNPFQSFSADINISQGTTQIGGFGGGFAQGGDYNLLVGARVPVDRVLSTAQTGFGAKLESEIVVMGRLTDTVAYRAGTRVAEALLRQAEERVIEGGVSYLLADGTEIQVLANADSTYTLKYLDGPQPKLGNGMKRGASKTYKSLQTLNRNLKAMGLSNVYTGQS